MRIFGTESVGLGDETPRGRARFVTQKAVRRPISAAGAILGVGSVRGNASVEAEK